jgi:hypothetical protein
MPILKNFKKISVFLLFIIGMMIFSGCFFGTPIDKTVTPVIRAIGIPDASAITSMTISATDSEGVVLDETTLSSLPSIPTEFTLSIPEGTNITFELTINIETASTIASYKGTALADISAGSADVIITMGIERTRIVVPDFQNSRVLQFDDINDTEATVLDSNNPVFNTFLVANMLFFGVYDVDFDNNGRIFIAENGGGSGVGVIRVDNILGTNAVLFGSSHGGIVALAVDRTNSFIYYANNYDIYRSDLDGSNEITIALGIGETITGLCVDDDGSFLYFADQGISIFQYNLSNDISTEITDVNINQPGDVLVKGNKLYATNNWGANGYLILEFATSDLSLTGNYGNFVGDLGATNIESGNFYGPRMFAAHMNDEITIIDEYYDSGSGNNFDKIIQLNNINGDNWITLPAIDYGDDSGQSLFFFFFLDSIV